MECPNCKALLNFPPKIVLAQMSNLIKRRCDGCSCHVQLNQETEEITVTYNPKDETNASA